MSGRPKMWLFLGITLALGLVTLRAWLSHPPEPPELAAMVVVELQHVLRVAEGQTVSFPAVLDQQSRWFGYWVSADTTIAQIDQDGVLTTRMEGKTKIETNYQAAAYVFPVAVVSDTISANLEMLMVRSAFYRSLWELAEHNYTIVNEEDREYIEGLKESIDRQRNESTVMFIISGLLTLVSMMQRPPKHVPEVDTARPLTGMEGPIVEDELPEGEEIVEDLSDGQAEKPPGTANPTG